MGTRAGKVRHAPSHPSAAHSPAPNVRHVSNQPPCNVLRARDENISILPIDQSLPSAPARRPRSSAGALFMGLNQSRGPSRRLPSSPSLRASRRISRRLEPLVPTSFGVLSEELWKLVVELSPLFVLKELRLLNSSFRSMILPPGPDLAFRRPDLAFLATPVRSVPLSIRANGSFALLAGDRIAVALDEDKGGVVMLDRQLGVLSRHQFLPEHTGFLGQVGRILVTSKHQLVYVKDRKFVQCLDREFYEQGLFQLPTDDEIVGLACYGERVLVLCSGGRLLEASFGSATRALDRRFDKGITWSLISANGRTCVVLGETGRGTHLLLLDQGLEVAERGLLADVSKVLALEVRIALAMALIFAGGSRRLCLPASGRPASCRGAAHMGSASSH
jgi:hypothetical protein